MSALLRSVEAEIAKRERERSGLRTKVEGELTRIKILEAELRELNSFKEGWESVNRPALPAPGKTGPRPAPADLRGVQAQITACLQEHGRMAPGKLKEAIGLISSTDTFYAHLNALLDVRIIYKEGQGRACRYGLTADRDAQEAEHGGRSPQKRGQDIAGLRSCVIEAIDADPGALTEERLAIALDADREDIAIAVGKLIEENVVAMLFDKTLQVIIDIDEAA